MSLFRFLVDFLLFDGSRFGADTVCGQLHNMNDDTSKKDTDNTTTAVVRYIDYE